MRFLGVMRTVAWRSLHHFVTNPAFLIPSLLFPTFFFAAFAGGLAKVGDIPGFDYPAGDRKRPAHTTFLRSTATEPATATTSAKAAMPQPSASASPSQPVMNRLRAASIRYETGL